MDQFLHRVRSGIQEETSLIDIGLRYAMISFLAVVLLTKVYSGAYLEKKMREREKEAENDRRL